MTKVAEDKDRWPLRRNITVVLLVICAAFLGLFIVRGVWDANTITLSVNMVFGLMLGVMYLGRRGRFPEWIHRLARLHASLTWRGAPVIVADDDPGNISPKVYLPLIIGAMVIGVVLVWWVI